MSTPTTAGWNPDPAGHHQYRYFDGYRWTDQVSDNGATSTDITDLGVINGPLLTGGPPPPMYAPVKKKSSNTWIKVVLGMFAVGALFVVGCAVLIGGAANEVSKQLDKEQAAHAISPATFSSMSIGDRKSEVLATAGVEPESKQEFESESFLDKEPSKSSCIYFNKAGGSFGDVYQLCFEGNRLRSKNAF